jgi:hypothetical protein
MIVMCVGVDAQKQSVEVGRSPLQRQKFNKQKIHNKQPRGLALCKQHNFCNADLHKPKIFA